MIDGVSFLNSAWLWGILLIALLVWLVFAWKERDKFGSSKFIIHLGISLVAITSLVLIALQPQAPVKQDTQLAAIVTEGYNQAQLDSLLKANKGLEIYTYKIGEAIFDTEITPSSVFILGHGIRSFDQWQLENIPTFYLGGKELSGITQLNYDYYQTNGNRVQIDGHYKNPIKNNRLVLEGPGGTALDSVTLTDETSQLFEVSTDLNVIGNFVYHLVEKDSLGTVLTKDILPLTIVEKSPLKVLILNGFPTFESKYLKNYLAEAGHQVVVKNQLTTARYKYEYFNMSSRPKVDLTQENLEFFDLLIIDNKSIRGLSSRQRATLKNTVSESGLGILIQPDASYFRSNKLVSSFSFDSEANKEAVLSAYPKQNLKKYFYQFKDDFAIQPIHNSESKIWSAYQRLGSGRVGTTVFKNTYELILNGQTKQYQSLWSKIIEKISKPTKPFVQWGASDNLAIKDLPFKFDLRTTVLNPTVESNDGYTVSLQRDVHVKSLWKGTVYPKSAGWKQHNISQDSTEVFNYYATDSRSWESITNFNTIKSNQIRFNNGSTLETSPKDTLILVNPLWFFVIFILSAGYLWLEPKL